MCYLYRLHTSDSFVFPLVFKGWDFEVFEDGNNGIDIGDGL